MNLPFSGKLSFIQTEMYWPINHMVSSKDKSVNCTECHTRDNSRLSGLRDFYMPARDYSKVIDNAGIGILILSFIGVFSHGTLRIISSRKLKRRRIIMKNKIYIYRAFERFWHWMQAIIIFFLAATGFEIHGSITFFGYRDAVKYHNIAAYSFIVLIVFTIFWHFTTGEWKQYLPTIKNMKAQINYYLFGIFKNAPHPTKKTVLSKLNPLQKIVYFVLKVLIIPIMIISGLLYMFYRYPQKGVIEGLNIKSIETIALLHTAGAFLLLSFIVVHLYLITTGATITSNLKAMITGYEELESGHDGETINGQETEKNIKNNKAEVVNEAGK